MWKALVVAAMTASCLLVTSVEGLWKRFITINKSKTGTKYGETCNANLDLRELYGRSNS